MIEMALKPDILKAGYCLVSSSKEGKDDSLL